MGGRMITGGCLCGRIRYRADGQPLFGVLCHCRDCQRASGTGHVPVMGVARTAFRVSGQARSYTTIGGSGHSAIRHFCPDCGSLLFGTPESAPQMVTIYVGSLDDPSLFRPQAAIFTQSRHAWDVGAETLPEFLTISEQT
jgi:hypothetical protein